MLLILFYSQAAPNCTPPASPIARPSAALSPGGFPGSALFASILKRPFRAIHGPPTPENHPPFGGLKVEAGIGQFGASHRAINRTINLFQPIDLRISGRCRGSARSKQSGPALRNRARRGLSASTVRVPIFAKQKWSSCAAADAPDSARAVSTGLIHGSGRERSSPKPATTRNKTI
jgi:hypothetical protein